MLEVLKPGLMCSVQDGGRAGWRALGVTAGGAMDRPALALANLLVANPVAAAGLEIGGGPLSLRFLRDSWFALSGAHYEAHLAGRVIHAGWRQRARAGEILQVNGPRAGLWLYLAVDGGIAVDEVLGARSTDLQAGMGGFEGRALRAGDQLPLGAPVPDLRLRCGVRLPEWDGEVRAMAGPEHAEFSAASRREFWTREWQVSSQSNRMGYRLQGERLLREGADMLSHLVLPGVVQVPPGGQPIVLMADAQTTGGYPRIACVIEADLWKVAQARPGARIRFRQVDAAQALRARKAWAANLARFEWSSHEC